MHKWKTRNDVHETSDGTHRFVYHINFGVAPKQIHMQSLKKL